MRIGGLICSLTLPFCAGCVHNLANVRTLASSLTSMTSDTSSMIQGDEASCASNATLQEEFMNLFPKTKVVELPCQSLHRVLESIVSENKALEAYGDALNHLASDQFVTATEDSDKVTKTLTGLNVSAPVVAAVGSILTTVETAALDGYRQKEIQNVLSKEVSINFEMIVKNYRALAQQYFEELQSEERDLDLIGGAIVHDYRIKEPLAVQEFSVRLTDVRQSIGTKKKAVVAFQEAISKINPAFKAAKEDLDQPNPKEIYQDVKDFAKKVKDAHDKLQKAFG